MNVDEHSFVGVYDEFAPKILKYCQFRVSSKEDAEDIASHVFIRAWDYLANGKAVENMRAFLYQIAHNLVIDHYRKNKDAKEISLDNPENPIDIPAEATFPDEMDHELLMKHVKGKMTELPDNYREAIILRYVNDLSIKEVAQAMAVTENNASVILHRATDKLKQLV